MKGRVMLLVSACLAVTACSVEPGSTKWCEAKKEQPKTEWTLEDAGTFAKHCLLDSSTVGSDAWCDNLADRPKGEWTADEAASYAKHCVM